MKNIKRLTPLLLGIFLISCSSRNGAGDGNALHITPLRATQEVEDLTPYIADLQIVQVGPDSVAIPGISKILFSDPVLFLARGAVYATTPDFRELRQVGRFGRGPGEYLSVKDVAVNADGDEIWCMDVTNAVFRYDLKTLSYLGRIDFKMDQKEYIRAMIPQENSTVTLYTPNPPGGFPQKDETFSCLTLCDLSGEVIDRQLPWTQFNVMAAFSIPVSANATGEYILTPESSSISYVFSPSGLDRQIAFDFGSKWIPRNFFIPNDPDHGQKLGDLFDRDCYKLISSVFYSGQDLYFMAFGKDSSRWNFYIPGDGSRGIRWRSIGGAAPPICAIASDGEYLLFDYEDYAYAEDDERDPLKKCVLQKFGRPQKTAASYLIKVRFQ